MTKLRVLMLSFPDFTDISLISYGLQPSHWVPKFQKFTELRG